MPLADRRHGPLIVRVFSGLSAFCITPADATGRVIGADLTVIVQRLAHAGVDSIGVLGSTGAYMYLDRHARRTAIEIARSAAPDTPLLAGIGAMRSADVIDHARDARQAGADALLLAPVAYWPLTDDEVLALFTDVARSTDLPICVYNNPTTTGVAVSTALLGRLAAIDNVVAAKNPASPADRMAADHSACAAAAGNGMRLGYSGDGRAVAALLAGGAAWYSVMAGVFPAACVRIVDAVESGHVEAAEALDARLAPLWALCTELSSFRVAYAAAELLGLTQALPPRPVLPLAAAEREQLAELIDVLQLS